MELSLCLLEFLPNQKGAAWAQALGMQKEPCSVPRGFASGCGWVHMSVFVLGSPPHVLMSVHHRRHPLVPAMATIGEIWMRGLGVNGSALAWWEWIAAGTCDTVPAIRAVCTTLGVSFVFVIAVVRRITAVTCCYPPTAATLACPCVHWQSCKDDHMQTHIAEECLNSMGLAIVGNTACRRS